MGQTEASNAGSDGCTRVMVSLAMVAVATSTSAAHSAGSLTVLLVIPVSSRTSARGFVGEAVAEVEGVLVHRAVVVLDLPIIAIEVRQIERIDAVPIARRRDAADLVLVLHVDGGLVGRVDRVLAVDLEPPMIEHAHRLDLVADL